MWTWGHGLVLTTLVGSCVATRFSRESRRDEPEVRALRARNVIEASAVTATYDFVICGGGVAGLVLANRLTEDANTTVLVIEAGGTGEDVASSIDVPANAYYASLLQTDSDWNYQTTDQAKANGQQLTWPRGKVLGGSSAINGMYVVRPSQPEFDAWSALMAGNDSANTHQAWNWTNMLAAMEKSETFTAPSSAIAKTGDIEYSNSSRGTNGPLQASFPGYMLPTVASWSPTLEAVGVPPTGDAYSGQNWGSFVATSSINPSNFTRSYAKSAYLDPLPPRSNLHVLTGNTVARLVFSGSNTTNLTATQVQYSAGDGEAVKTVNVGKEVLLTGGAVGSPQILMLSGVGPEDVLNGAGVNPTLILPGVGHHLQDHIASQVIWSTSASTDASMYSDKYEAAPGSSSSFLSFVNSATAYVNASTLMGVNSSGLATFQQQLLSTMKSGESTLVPSKDPSVIAGYEAIYNLTASSFVGSQLGMIELLLGLTGTAEAGDGSLAIQAALQHPFSQGQIYITSDDPFDYPAINPNYLTHPADLTLLREGLKLARKIGQTPPLSKILTGEVLPGSDVQTDSDWNDYIAGAVTTEYHPSCTCAMLPLSQGGVVDAELKVYGMTNVRVADSSVYPIEFAAHLQAATYGLAEQAASIIRAQYNGNSLPWSPPPSATTTSGGQATASSTPANKSGAISHINPHSVLSTLACGAILAASVLLCV